MNLKLKSNKILYNCEKVNKLAVDIIDFINIIISFLYRPLCGLFISIITMLFINKIFGYIFVIFIVIFIVIYILIFIIFIKKLYKKMKFYKTKKFKIKFLLKK